MGAFQVSICSDDGLALYTWQVIVWSNGGLVYWHIYASPEIIDASDDVRAASSVRG